MRNRVGELEAEMLSLPPQERARLAEKLISSSDECVDSDVEALWLEEAERRLGEMESGQVSGVPADRVFEKVRSSLR